MGAGPDARRRLSDPIESTAEVRSGRRSRTGRLIVSLATALTLLGIAVALVLPPIVVNTAIDLSGAPQILGIGATEAHRVSEQAVGELVWGPGTFEIAGPDGAPFFDPSEIAHLQDARTVLYGFGLVVGLAALVTIGALVRDRRAAASSIRRGAGGLAIAVIVIGVVALVAFDPIFELFHRIFFPGGNWAFDPARQRLVQLYPTAFWQLVSAAVGVIAVLLSAVAWWLARRAERTAP